VPLIKKKNIFPQGPGQFTAILQEKLNQTIVEEDEINIDEDDEDTSSMEVKEKTLPEVTEKTVTSPEVKSMREYLCNKCSKDSRLFLVFEK
jgi:hypothetical protein